MRSLWPRGGLWRHADFLKLWSARRRSASSARRSRCSRCRSSRSSSSTRARSRSARSARSSSCPSCSSRCRRASGSIGCRGAPILIVGRLRPRPRSLQMPVAYALDALTMRQLYVVGFLVGHLHGLLRRLLPVVPAVARRARADRRGNSKLEVSRTAAQVTGPGVAGGLVGLITAPYAVLVDAVSFLRLARSCLRSGSRGAGPRGDERAKPRMRHGAAGGAALRRRSPVPAPARHRAPGPRTSSRTSTFAVFLVYRCDARAYRPRMIGLIFTIGGRAAWPTSALWPPTASCGGSASGATTIAMELMWERRVLPRAARARTSRSRSWSRSGCSAFGIVVSTSPR